MDDHGHLMNARVAVLDQTGAIKVKQSIIFVLLHYIDDIRQVQGMNKIGAVMFAITIDVIRETIMIDTIIIEAIVTEVILIDMITAITANIIIEALLDAITEAIITEAIIDTIIDIIIFAPEYSTFCPPSQM
jgi:hypothetical protein